jgi:hypothetical protein
VVLQKIHGTSIVVFEQGNRATHSNIEIYVAAVDVSIRTNALQIGSFLAGKVPQNGWLN